MGKKNRKKKQEDSASPKKSLRPLIVKIGIATVALIVVFFFILNNCDDESSNMHYYKFKKEGELTFTDSTGGPTVKIDIEIADNDYERQLGLMNRESMEEMQGMLFIFPDERYQSFWMMNTLFSLDILFIDSKKEIVTIHKSTKPLSEQSYPSSKPAVYVLEVNAGFCDRHNIKLGDKIFWMETKSTIPNKEIKHSQETDSYTDIKNNEDAKKFAIGTWTHTGTYPNAIWMRYVIDSDGTYEEYAAIPTSDGWKYLGKGNWEVGQSKYVDTGKKYYYIRFSRNDNITTGVFDWGGIHFKQMRSDGGDIILDKGDKNPF